MADWIPSDDGLLAKWQLFVAVTAVASAGQNLSSTYFSRRLYDNKVNQGRPRPSLFFEQSLDC